ncbi:MAG: WD40 repeat domain-containing protein [Waterburya sp.]
MSNRRYFKCLTIAISLILPWAIALGFQSSAQADTKPNNTTNSPLNFQDPLAAEWEKATLTQIESPTEINTLKFSPDGETIAGVGAGQIMLWKVDTGEVQRILPGHYTPKLKMKIAPTAIAFSPDSDFLATATWSQGLLTPDRSIVVWDITTGEEVLSLTDSGGCRQVLFDVEGEILYGACGLGITAWSFPEGEKLFSFATQSPLEAIALSPNSQVMATAEVNITGAPTDISNHPIQLWQLNQDQPTKFKTLNGHANNLAQLEFTADGTKLVSSSYDGKINVWNWQTGEISPQTNNLYSHNGLFSLSPNNRLLAGNFHSSVLTNLITGLPLNNLKKINIQGETNTVAFSPQEQLLAQIAKSAPSVINLWQTKTNQSQQLPTVRDNYLPLTITEYWGNYEQLGGGENIELITNNPSPIGQDPKAITLAAIGLTETVESEQQQVELDYPRENLATVTITQTNLSDDSLAAIRYLVKFAPYGDADGEQWQVIWAGQQFKCRANRGHQDWSEKLCQ